MEDLKKIVADIYNIEPADVTESLNFRELASWDSFKHLVMVNEIEQARKMSFTIEQIESLSTVKDILTILEEK